MRRPPGPRLILTLAEGRPIAREPAADHTAAPLPRLFARIGELLAHTSEA